MKAEGRMLDRMERREQAAESMIGELCRDGQTIFYGRVANTSGGSYHPAKAGIFMLC